MKYLIFVISLLSLSGCLLGAKNLDILTNGNYYFTYLKDSNNYIASFGSDFEVSEYGKYRDIESLFQVNEELIAITLKGPKIRTILYDTVSMKEVLSINDVWLFSYLGESKLFVGWSHNKKGKSLNLYDLKFNIVSKITDNALQFDNLSISGNEFIYSQRLEDNLVFYKYSLVTGTSVELSSLSRSCSELLAYRSKENQIICKAGRETKLVSMDTGKSIEFNVVKGFVILFYDKDLDALLGSRSSDRGGYSFDLELYSFENEEFHTIKKDLLVTNIHRNVK